MHNTIFILPDYIYDDASDIFNYILAMHQMHHVNGGNFKVVVNDEKTNRNYNYITPNLRSAVFFIYGLTKGMTEKLIKDMNLTTKYCCVQYGNDFFAFYEKNNQVELG